MSEETCVAIEIIKKIPFLGLEDTIETRLRNVSLRGFPDVKIYGEAEFEFVFLKPEQIERELHTPQPSIYQTHLDKINSLYELFMHQSIDIFNLNEAYDFIATSESRTKTEWTMLPPIVERFYIPKTKDRMFDYSSLIGKELTQRLKQEGLGVNSEILQVPHTSKDGWFNEINDGSHRVHSAFQKNLGIKIIRVSNLKHGFPYYAVPQHYSHIRLHETRDDSAIETKIHVVDAPGHKHLYRLFPSGGIKSGDVRSDKKLVE